MSQFITIQVGQCGNQIGEAFWPLALHEHGVQVFGGGMNLLKTQGDHIKHMDDLSDAFNSFFYVPRSTVELSFKKVGDLNAAKVKARAVLIDMEDSVVSRFKQGPLRRLFDQTCTVTNYPGSGNNWAVGYYSHGTAYYDKIEEAIRRSAERCDSLHGFLITQSLGGGTGSGLGTSTLKLLSDNYPQVDRFVSCVYPAVTQDVITAPYNVMLATAKLAEHATCVFPADNSALLDICNLDAQKRDNKDQSNYNATCRPFQDMNSIIVNMLLHLTSGARFPGSLNMDMNEIATNLVAYPQLHYIFGSVSPISLTAAAVSTSRGTKLQDELFSSVWSRKNQLLKVDPLSPKSVIIGSAHIARGNASLTDIRRNIERFATIKTSDPLDPRAVLMRCINIYGVQGATYRRDLIRFQTKAKFTTWSKEATKVGLCSVPPAGHPASLLCLLNSSSMSLMLNDVMVQFDRLYQRKAHVHHYLEVDGFEEANFHEARSTVLSVCERYTELQAQNPTIVPRLQLM